MKNHAIVFGGVTLFWLILFATTGLLTAGLHFDTDAYNTMLAYHNDGKSLGEDVKSAMESFKQLVFAPIGLFYVVATAKLFGGNIEIARLGYLILGILSTFLFFLAGRKMGFSIALSLLFPALSFFGVQFWVWYNVNSHEPLGLFFMALSFYLIALSAEKGILFDFLALLSSLCMSLSKENFILVLPALVVIKLYFLANFQKDIKKIIVKSLLFSIPILLVFLAEIAYILIVMKGGGRGYAGVSASAGVGAYAQTFFMLFSPNDVYLYVICSLFLLLFMTGGQLLGNLLTFIEKNFLLLLLILAIIVPQIVVYTQTGWQLRYYLPAFVGISLFLVLVLVHLKDFAPSGTYHFLFALLITYLALEMTPKITDNPDQTFRAARNYVSFAQQGEQFTQSIVSQSQPNSLILIVNDPVENVVTPAGLEIYLRKLHGRTNIKNLPLSIPFDHTAVSEQRISNAPNTFAAIEDKTTIEHIAIMPHREKLFLHEQKAWFDPAKYNRFAFWKLVHYAKKTEK